MKATLYTYNYKYSDSTIESYHVVALDRNTANAAFQIWVSLLPYVNVMPLDFTCYETPINCYTTKEESERILDKALDMMYNESRGENND